MQNQAENNPPIPEMLQRDAAKRIAILEVGNRAAGDAVRMLLAENRRQRDLLQRRFWFLACAVVVSFVAGFLGWQAAQWAFS